MISRRRLTTISIILHLLIIQKQNRSMLHWFSRQGNGMDRGIHPRMWLKCNPKICRGQWVGDSNHIYIYQCPTGTCPPQFPRSENGGMLREMFPKRGMFGCTMIKFAWDDLLLLEFYHYYFIIVSTFVMFV